MIVKIKIGVAAGLTALLQTGSTNMNMSTKNSVKYLKVDLTLFMENFETSLKLSFQQVLSVLCVCDDVTRWCYITRITQLFVSKKFLLKSQFEAEKSLPTTTQKQCQPTLTNISSANTIWCQKHRK